MKLKPQGFVIATGHHKLLFPPPGGTAHVFERLRHELGTKLYDVPYAMTVVRDTSSQLTQYETST